MRDIFILIMPMMYFIIIIIFLTLTHNNNKSEDEECTHEEWDMDKQILVIQCKKCGKRAWVKEIKNLFENESASNTP